MGEYVFMCSWMRAAASPPVDSEPLSNTVPTPSPNRLAIFKMIFQLVREPAMRVRARACRCQPAAHRDPRRRKSRRPSDWGKPSPGRKKHGRGQPLTQRRPSSGALTDRHATWPAALNTAATQHRRVCARSAVGSRAKTTGQYGRARLREPRIVASEAACAAPRAISTGACVRACECVRASSTHVHARPHARTRKHAPNLTPNGQRATDRPQQPDPSSAGADGQ